jgi:hypothetical protein
LRYLAICPGVDHRGKVRSVRARLLSDPGAAVEQPKAVAPLGFSFRRLCLADEAGRRWLASDRPVDTLYLVEGEPAWLAWRAAGHHALGIVSGTAGEEWAPVVARARRVVLVLDHDGGEAAYRAAWERVGVTEVWDGDKDTPPVTRGDAVGG